MVTIVGYATSGMDRLASGMRGIRGYSRDLGYVPSPLMVYIMDLLIYL
jgi:hypothetical protein